MTYSHLSPKTQEMLNAYLDGELQGRQRQELERRLRAEPELAQALTELRAIKGNLASLPRKRAPRNFTLTPAQAGIKTRRRRRLWQWAVWGATGSLTLLVVGILLLIGGTAILGTKTASAPARIQQKPAPLPLARPASPEKEGKNAVAEAQPTSKHQRRFLSLSVNTPTPTLAEKQSRSTHPPTFAFAVVTPNGASLSYQEPHKNHSAWLALVIAAIVIAIAILAIIRRRNKGRP